MSEIHSNLTSAADVTQAVRLEANSEVAFSGTKKAGDFNITEQTAADWLLRPNPHHRPNSDLLRPWCNGTAIVQRPDMQWIVDTDVSLSHDDFARFETPYDYVLKFVKPDRDKNKRETRRDKWWLHAEECPAMRSHLNGYSRFIVTPRVSKHRIFIWLDSEWLCDDGVYAFARSDDYFFGILHSRAHEIWARSQGTQVRERESGFRYTPTTCFETFPFPGRWRSSGRPLPQRRRNSTTSAPPGSIRPNGPAPKSANSPAPRTAPGHGT